MTEVPLIAWLLLAAWVWPLLLVAPALTRRFWWLAPVGAVPALITAFAVPLGTRLDLPWLMLGTHLGLDEIGRIYLVFTSIVWLAAGVFAASMRWRTVTPPDAETAGSIKRPLSSSGGRFGALFLLAMAGNFWLILGLDLISFYVGFAIMGLASYALVIHDDTPGALRAGKVYLSMTLVGEVILFAAMAMIATETGTTLPTPEQLATLNDLTIALVLIGLMIKAGIVPLHLWLPLAYPAAPIPASAVLSGAMSKVALLGWLRFLPVGVMALPHWGAALITAGLFSLFFGLAVGLMQRDPKAILAYSSISKMGFLLVLLGLIFLEPALAPVGVIAIALYAAQHGLVKGGLFLGVGLRQQAAPMRQPLILAGLVLLALAMAGAPLTIGAVAKYTTKPLFAELPAAWGWLAAAVVLSTIATTALMARLIWLGKETATRPVRGEAGAEIAWALLLLLIMILPFTFGEPAAWLGDGVPLALGLVLVATVVWFARGGHRPLEALVGRVPVGDLLGVLVPVYRLVRVMGAVLWHDWQAAVTRGRGLAWHQGQRLMRRLPEDPERNLRAWPVVGALWLGIGGALLLFLLAGRPGVPEALSGGEVSGFATEALAA